MTDSTAPHLYSTQTVVAIIALTIRIQGNNTVATGVFVQITIRDIGNSKGVVLPKPLLAQAGLDDQGTADMTVENGAIVSRRPAKAVRAGWAECAKAVAANGGDVLVMGAPMTSKGFPAPFRVPLTHAGTTGLILLDQLRIVDKARLAKRLGAVSAKTLTAVLVTLQEVFAE